MCWKTREVEKENSLLQFNNIEKEWMESSIINPVLQKWSCYVNTLSFNSVVCSLGVCVCIYAFTGVYTARAYDRMRFDGFLALRAAHAFVLVCVSLCVGVCVSERSLHIVIQETHMIACDWGVRRSRLPAQTVQRGPARRNRLDVNVRVPLRNVGSAWKHLDGDVLFQALKAGGERCRNYLCGFSASFSAACTITSARRGMESEKDLSRGWCNSGYTGIVTYWMWVCSFGHLMRNIWTLCVCVRIPFLLIYVT